MDELPSRALAGQVRVLDAEAVQDGLVTRPIARFSAVVSGPVPRMLTTSSMGIRYGTTSEASALTD